MTDLMQIQPFIQAYVLAISSILGAEVTVVDSNLIRVGGTGGYAEQTGQKISHDSYFQNVLSTGRPGIIKDVKKEFTCNSCEKRDHCKELANLAYPIFLGGNVAGVIGIIAFRESERERLLKDQSKLEEFLKYMSVLIESKIITTRQNYSLESQLSEVIRAGNGPDGASDFVGRSQRVLEILSLVKKVAGFDSTVLISGESGTGKEVLAKIIHAKSPRADKLMISVNCGAIPDNLVESELFGYEEGAFTGAKKSGHIGKFELANGSTLFLDEVGEMPLSAQTKLLRVLQEQTVERLGGKTVIPIDVRVVCATNCDLKEMVAQGRFRQDLYYRLNVIPIELPPLRERREDIPLFIGHFIAHYNRRLRKSIQGIEPEAERLLAAYDWPGNVRELKNIVEYLENMAEGDVIRAADLPGQFLLSAQTASHGQTLDAIMAEYEKRVLSRLVKTAATLERKNTLAAQLGVSRATLYRKLGSYDLL